MVGSCLGTSLVGVRCLLCMTPCSSATPNPSEGLVTRSESSCLQHYGPPSLSGKPGGMPDTPGKAVAEPMLSGPMMVNCCVCLASCLRTVQSEQYNWICRRSGC